MKATVLFLTISLLVRLVASAKYFDAVDSRYCAYPLRTITSEEDCVLGRERLNWPYDYICGKNYTHVDSKVNTNQKPPGCFCENKKLIFNIRGAITSKWCSPKQQCICYGAGTTKKNKNDDTVDTSNTCIIQYKNSSTKSIAYGQPSKKKGTLSASAKEYLSCQCCKDNKCINTKKVCNGDLGLIIFLIATPFYILIFICPILLYCGKFIVGDCKDWRKLASKSTYGYFDEENRDAPKIIGEPMIALREKNNITGSQKKTLKDLKLGKEEEEVKISYHTGVKAIGVALDRGISIKFWNSNRKQKPYFHYDSSSTPNNNRPISTISLSKGDWIIKIVQDKEKLQVCTFGGQVFAFTDGPDKTIEMESTSRLETIQWTLVPTSSISFLDGTSYVETPYMSYKAINSNFCKQDWAVMEVDIPQVMPSQQNTLPLKLQFPAPDVSGLAVEITVPKGSKGMNISGKKLKLPYRIKHNQDDGATKFIAKPGYMIVGMKFEESNTGSKISSIVETPVTLVYGSRTHITRWRVLCKKRAIMRNIIFESITVLLDIVALYLLWALYSPDRPGWVTFVSSPVPVLPITECVENWDTVVKPCLKNLPSPFDATAQTKLENCCGCGYVNNRTQVTFAFAKDIPPHSILKSCKNINTGIAGNSSSLNCTMDGVTLVIPKTHGGIFDSRTQIPDAVALNMKVEHTHCVVTENFNSNIWISVVWVSIWKILHIVLEIRLISIEVLEESGALPMHHDEKKSKFQTLLGKVLKSFLTLLITLPSNYFYTAMLTLGKPLSLNSIAGEADFIGPGVFLPESVEHINISLLGFYGLISILALAMFTVGRGIIVGGACIASILKQIPPMKKFMANAHLNSELVGTTILVLIPFMMVQVAVFVAVFRDYAGKTMSLYNMLFSVNFTAEFGKFNTFGLAVSLAGVQFASNFLRHLVLILHLHPENIKFCFKYGRNLRPYSKQITKNLLNAEMIKRSTDKDPKTCETVTFTDEYVKLLNDVGNDMLNQSKAEVGQMINDVKGKMILNSNNITKTELNKLLVKIEESILIILEKLSNDDLIKDLRERVEATSLDEIVSLALTTDVSPEGVFEMILCELFGDDSSEVEMLNDPTEDAREFFAADETGDDWEEDKEEAKETNLRTEIRVPEYFDADAFMNKREMVVHTPKGIRVIGIPDETRGKRMFEIMI